MFKKIIIVSYTHIVGGKFTTIGGPGLALRDYLQERVERLVCVWQPLPVSDELSIIIEDCKNNSIRVSKLPVPNLPFGRKKTISFAYFYCKLRDLFSVYFAIILLRSKFDIFVGVEALDALIGVTLRKVGLVKKVIYYNLDYGPQRFPIPLLNSLFHLLDKLAVNNSDITWCLSEQMLLERELKGIKSSKERPQIIVPIGNYFQVNPLSFEAIERTRIVFLGVLEKLQGVQLVIDAFPELLKIVPQASLIIIGSGNYQAELEEMVKKMGLERNIRFTGTIFDEEVKQLLLRAAIGVAPYMDHPDSTTRFTEPTKPKTYLSCGLPVVITRVPERSASSIEKAGAGIAINFDKDELIEAITKLLLDDELYKKFRQNAIKLSSQSNWNNIFDEAFKCTLFQ
jgi:glycosyltransferase involved in cell wall biosynthesis